MIIDSYTPRRVRIIGKPDGLSGYSVQIQNAETGEMITNVAKAVVTLQPDDLNCVELTYHEADAEAGVLLRGPDGGPTEKQAKRDDPEIDVTALERMTLAEAVAQCFHATYERLAPKFGYETRKASAVPWKDVPENNKRLMITVADEVLQALNYGGNDGRS